jgi:micrococcal nuclease
MQAAQCEFRRKAMRLSSSAVVALACLAPVAAFAQSTGPINQDSIYIYRANVTDVYDADTIIADVDLGFYVWLHRQEFRLHGIDAPEVTGSEKAEGDKARDFLRSKILGKEVIIQSILNRNEQERKEKYGEFLAIVWLEGVNLNDLLIKEGYVKAVD